MKLEYLKYEELKTRIFNLKTQYDGDYAIKRQTYKNKINSNFKYLNYDFKNGIHWTEKPTYLCLFDDDILKGVLKFVYPWKEEIVRNLKQEFVCLFYLETNSEFKNQKVATQISEEIFKFCKKENKPFMTSYYEEDGKNYLQKLFQRFSLKYDIPFLDRDGFNYIKFNWK